jgi:hypothetical protein
MHNFFLYRLYIRISIRRPHCHTLSDEVVSVTDRSTCKSLDAQPRLEH